MLKSAADLEQYQGVIKMLLEDCESREDVATVLQKPEYVALANQDLMFVLITQAVLGNALAEQTDDKKAQKVAALLLDLAAVVAEVLHLEFPTNLEQVLGTGDTDDDDDGDEDEDESNTLELATVQGFGNGPDYVVQKFNREMLKRYVTQHKLAYLTDRDGDTVLEFGYQDNWDCELKIFLIATGRDKDVYHLLAVSTKRIGRNKWEHTQQLCNSWNNERRWPRAFLQVNDPAQDRTGTIQLDQHYNLESGIHQKLLDDLTSTFVSGVSQFWEWAHEKQGL